MIHKIKVTLRGIKQYKEFLKVQAEKYSISLVWLYVDCLFSRFIHGALPVEYIDFSLYKLNYRERKQFVTKRRSSRLERLFNSSNTDEDKNAFYNKHVFNEVFSKYVHRDWLYAPDSSEQQMKDFLLRNDIAIVKPSNSNRGKGIYKIECKQVIDDVAVFLEKLKDENCLLEAFIQQNKVLAEVNPTSVNTVRVCSVRDKDGEVHIVGACLRAGKGNSIVDNHGSGGVKYPVDVNTGLVIGAGSSRDGKRGMWCHPSTGAKVIGLRIPNWQHVLSMVIEAGRMPKGYRYIGWDVAITEDGCELVEANCGQGNNVLQSDGIGKYPIIMQYA